MVDDPDECLQRLRDAGLHKAATVVPVLDTDEVGIIVAVDGTSWFDAWQIVRDLVPTTRRWPVAVEDWGGDGRFDVFTRFDIDRVPGLDVRPHAILARVGAFDLNAALDAEERRQNDAWRPNREAIGWELAETRRRFGDAPTVEELLAELGPRPGQLDVERFLFDWECDRTLLVPTDDAYLDWFEPANPSLVLLPDPAPTAAWAYLGGFAWGHPHPDIRSAALVRWHASFGVEPAANWGTMQQLAVPRPPTEPSQAFQLAREISLLWPDTAGAANGISTREHAWDLIGRPRWFLHYRP